MEYGIAVVETEIRRYGDMVATDRVREIFADAHGMYDDSLERWDAGDIRDAAEKAWCATLSATNALILANTGVEP